MDPFTPIAAGVELIQLSIVVVNVVQRQLPAQKTEDGYVHLYNAFLLFFAVFDELPSDVQEHLSERFDALFEEYTAQDLLSREVKTSSVQARQQRMREVRNGQRLHLHETNLNKLPPEVLAAVLEVIPDAIKMAEASQHKEILHRLRGTITQKSSNSSVSGDQPSSQIQDTMTVPNSIQDALFPEASPSGKLSVLGIISDVLTAPIPAEVFTGDGWEYGRTVTIQARDPTTGKEEEYTATCVTKATPLLSAHSLGAPQTMNTAVPESAHATRTATETSTDRVVVKHEDSAD
ncbi:hypothetical protein MSAN_01044800 [Mycena sanguinolenta]|uniref:Uncharacterized protein n=1 Tax=Mycena sanguinolenta TaxID=230812 RepID=A0A8H7D9J4_9AGAR|nr:hypothetical protein MSAN_01044800 [Mycena sanguinolenta]